MYKEFKAIIDKLTEENRFLKESIVTLQQTITSLEQTNLTLQLNISKLLEENNQLKERMGLHSTNSSLPLSRDLYRIKHKSRPPILKNPGGI